MKRWNYLFLFLAFALLMTPVSCFNNLNEIYDDLVAGKLLLPSPLVLSSNYMQINYDIYIADNDGLHKLTNNTDDDIYPASSPDGSKIAFVRDNSTAGTSILVMNSDGSAQTTLVTSSATNEYGQLAWSPDGTKIAFHSKASGNFNIYVMDSNGTNITALTSDAGSDKCPAWSPDGSKIAFQTNRDGKYQIYVMASNGSAQTRLTNSGSVDENPSWSPDGTKIAFDSDYPGNYDIYTINSDGSERTQITTHKDDDTRPVWSPEGSLIAFNTERHYGTSLYVMKTDGSSQKMVKGTEEVWDYLDF